MIWLDRAVKIEDGLLWLSRRGHHDDFNVGLTPKDNPAVAMAAPSLLGTSAKVTRAAVSGGLLFFVDSLRTYWFMTGDPFAPTTIVAAVPTLVHP